MCPYQVWRGGLGLRSVIIQVQIDQDFSCSPYSTGHFSYCQLAKSGGGGQRQRRGQLALRRKNRQGRGPARAPHPHANSMQARERQTCQSRCRHSETEERRKETLKPQKRQILYDSTCTWCLESLKSDTGEWWIYSLEEGQWGVTVHGYRVLIS